MDINSIIDYPYNTFNNTDESNIFLVTNQWNKEVLPVKLSITDEVIKLIAHCDYVQDHYIKRIVVPQLEALHGLQSKVHLDKVNSVSWFTVAKLKPLKCEEKVINKFVKWQNYKDDKGRWIFGDKPKQWVNKLLSGLARNLTSSTTTSYNIGNVPEYDHKQLYNYYKRCKLMYICLCQRNKPNHSSAKTQPKKDSNLRKRGQNTQHMVNDALPPLTLVSNEQTGTHQFNQQSIINLDQNVLQQAINMLSNE